MASVSSLVHVSITKIPLSSPSKTLLSHKNKCLGIRRYQSFAGRIVSESKELSADSGLTQKDSNALQIGSPIIIVEAPKMLKTAASVPCLRVNSDLVKAGDVGRIMSRKPKDVWAVRLAIGTYLIDGKYFKPLQLDEDN
ncbi:hypothetical protein Tco_0593010 [Tanacetum coccineum]